MKVTMEVLSTLAAIILISQVHASDFQETIVVPYADMLKENIASTQLQQQINSSMATVVANMATYDLFVRKLSDQVLTEYNTSIREKVSSFKSNVNSVQSRSLAFSSGRNIILKCLVQDSRLDVLANKVNEQVKKCATVAMAEMVNVVSDSLKEAQTFMSIPRVIGKDIQRCGLSYSCRWDIVGDAISEALQVPPKVYALTAKIQSIALRTVVSIDRCGLQGLREITETAVDVLGQMLLCISNNIDTNITPNRSTCVH